MRIFLDANALFSAAANDGAIHRLVKLIEACGHVGVVDAYVLQEARRNVQAKATLRNAAASAELEAIVLRLEQSFAQAQPLSATKKSTANWLPEKDRPVLWAAIALRCDVLITGDKTHFGAGYNKRFSGVKILSPAMLAALLLA